MNSSVMPAARGAEGWCGAEGRGQNQARGLGLGYGLRFRFWVWVQAGARATAGAGAGARARLGVGLGLGWVELAGRARLASVRGSNNDALAALECRRQLDTVLPVGRDDDLQRCLPAISIRRRHRRRRCRRRNVLSWRRLSAGGGKPREVSEFG